MSLTGSQMEAEAFDCLPFFPHLSFCQHLQKHTERGKPGGNSLFLEDVACLGWLHT